MQQIKTTADEYFFHGLEMAGKVRRVFFRTVRVAVFSLQSRANKPATKKHAKI
ncbi:MAG: hypothetical protein IPM98_00645 [Lewinellaceae bacterium]|nr:hypothetical protein [Lewinellaceae bacterium]